MEQKKGYFITFEGIDGCGKTTQIELLGNWLKSLGKKTLLTLEPGGSDLGKNLRQILLHYDKPVAKNAEMFLYLADRAQHVNNVISPALNQGEIVLCDRYTDSTLAYQGYAREGDVNELNMLNEIATNNLKSDLTIVFDIDVQTAQMRLGKTKDRLEKEGVDFHTKVKNGYLELEKLYPERIKTVNANRSIEEIFSDVKKIVGELLNI